MSEIFVKMNLDELENGDFLATSDEVPGLVAQGRTITETLEIAQDVTRKIIESYQEHGDEFPLSLRSKTIPIPQKAKISFKIDVDSTFNISAFVARQKANLYLLMHLGELVSAGQPELWMEKHIYWRLPIIYTLPSVGTLGTIGELLVQIDNGNIELKEPQSIKEIKNRVENLLKNTSLPAGVQV